MDDGACPPDRGPGSPAGPRRRGGPGSARLAGAPGRPGGTRPGLPARARRRGAARPAENKEHRDDGGGEMTALTMPARPEQDTSPRPVPWRRMAWVTWRQHRIALAGVAALLGAWAVYLWLTGLQMHHAYAAVTACHPASSIACGSMISSFRRTYMPSADALPSADAATIFMQA